MCEEPTDMKEDEEAGEKKKDARGRDTEKGRKVGGKEGRNKGTTEKMKRSSEVCSRFI